MPDDRSSGRYKSKWERLASALNRVTSAGIDENDAKQSICGAIADRVIEIRLALREHTTRHYKIHGRTFTGADVEIPARLSPQDMDFEHSRPLKPWLVPRERIKDLTGYWIVDWIELASADVTKALVPSSIDDEPTVKQGPHKRSPTRRRKSQTAREHARRIIREIYSNGIPDQATEPNAILCKRVGAKLKELNLRDVSDDTILRAAGRRK